jgi:hypothetical protein
MPYCNVISVLFITDVNNRSINVANDHMTNELHKTGINMFKKRMLKRATQPLLTQVFPLKQIPSLLFLN